MASQTFTIGSPSTSRHNELRWNSFDLGQSVNSALLSGEVSGYLGDLVVRDTGNHLRLLTSSSSPPVVDTGPDLTDAFETNGTVTISAGALSITIEIANAATSDTAEPYFWTFAGADLAAIQQFTTDYSRLRSEQQAATTLTLDDGVVASDAVAPTVAIDTIRDGDAGSTVQLSATLTGGTYDEVDYAWSVTGGSLSGSTSATPTLTHADVGADSDFVATLNITARGTGTVAVDGTSATAQDTETFTTLNVVPTGLGDETLFTSLASLGDVFTDVQTGSGGRWRYDSGGSSASAGTGPGSNNSLSFVHTETSSTSISQQAEAETRGLLVFTSLPDETGRELHLRLSIQGGFGDGTEGLRVEYQEEGSETWIEAEFFHGWAFSNSYVAGQTITDENGVSRTIAATGGWIDFEVDIPDTAIEVRLAPKYIFRSGQNTYTHDIAMRSLQWEWDIAPTGYNASSDSAGYGFGSLSVVVTVTEPGYEEGVNQAGYGFGSPSAEGAATIPGAGVGVSQAGYGFGSLSVDATKTEPDYEEGVNTVGFGFGSLSVVVTVTEPGYGDGAVNPAGYSFASHPVGAVALEAGVVVYIPDIPRVTSISSNRGSVTRVMGNGRPRFHGVAKDSYTVLVEHFLITEAEAGRLRRFHEGNESGRVSIKAVDGATYVGRFKAPYGVIPIEGNYYTARVQLVCNRA